MIKLYYCIKKQLRAIFCKNQAVLRNFGSDHPKFLHFAIFGTVSDPKQPPKISILFL